MASLEEGVGGGSWGYGCSCSTHTGGQSLGQGVFWRRYGLDETLGGFKQSGSELLGFFICLEAGLAIGQQTLGGDVLELLGQDSSLDETLCRQGLEFGQVGHG